MIVEFTRFAAQSSAGGDLSAQQVLEKNFSTKMTAIERNRSSQTFRCAGADSIYNA